MNLDSHRDRHTGYLSEEFRQEIIKKLNDSVRLGRGAEVKRILGDYHYDNIDVEDIDLYDFDQCNLTDELLDVLFYADIPFRYLEPLLDTLNAPTVLKIARYYGRKFR